MHFMCHVPIPEVSVRLALFQLEILFSVRGMSNIREKV